MMTATEPITLNTLRRNFDRWLLQLEIRSTELAAAYYFMTGDRARYGLKWARDNGMSPALAPHYEEQITDADAGLAWAQKQLMVLRLELARL